jgi:hypothetical protein
MAGSRGRGRSGSPQAQRQSLTERFPSGEPLILAGLESRGQVLNTPEGEAALRRYLSRPGTGRII